jgi:glucans biosynthesis protein
MHGGAAGLGAPRGNKNAHKHGRYTREAIAERRQLRSLLRQSRSLIQQIERSATGVITLFAAS